MLCPDRKTPQNRSIANLINAALRLAEHPSIPPKLIGVVIRPFKIAGGRAGQKVSWQVTGIRQDVWANAHRIPVEEPKSEEERGTYLHPELFGAPKEAGLSWHRYRYPDNVQPHEPQHSPALKRRSTAKPARTAALASH